MTCTLCKGSMELDKTSYLSNSDNSYIIIKNVPCNKCIQCGEEFIDGVTLQNIERIINKFEDILTEVALVDYRNAA